MNTATEELMRICEQLPEPKQAEVMDFARFLLSRQESGDTPSNLDSWLLTATGAATTGVTTDQVMELSRGEK